MIKKAVKKGEVIIKIAVQHVYLNLSSRCVKIFWKMCYNRFFNRKSKRWMFFFVELTNFFEQLKTP